MRSRFTSRCFRFCAVACIFIAGLLASEHHGLVKFGAVPVPGATVTATKDDKKVTAVTDTDGIYTFPDLEDGVWHMTVEMLTFETASKDIGIAPGAPSAEWDLKLKTMDEIKPAVQGAPPPATAPAAASGTAPAASSGSAPASPSPAATAAATANAPSGKSKGKKNAAAANTSPQVGFQRTDVNASSSSSAEPATSGAASGAPPSIAEAQSASDAFVVNGSTSNGIERRTIGNGRKGPRSLFSGGLDFRNFSNDYLNARSFSTTGEDTPRQPQTAYTAGGFLQGPLWVPHVFRWQGNFAVQYQTTRSRSSSTSPYTMPTEAERDGDFSALGTTILDPTTGQPVPNNIIPASEISPQARFLTNYYPLPQFTSAGEAYNYQAALTSRSVQDQFLTRVNKTINTKSSLNFQLTYQTGLATSSNVVSWVDSTHTSNYLGRAIYNRTFTRTMFGQFTAQYSRSSILATPFFANVENVSGLAGITGNDQSALNWGPPSLAFSGSGIWGLSDGTENFTRNQTLQLSSIVTYIHRPHNIQFGGDVKFQDFDTVGQSNPRGTFGFTGAAAGFDFADFLYGIPDTSSIAFGNADKYIKDRIYDAFINDDWKVTSSFTFQWGVRWTYATPATEEYGRLVNLDVLPGFSNAAPVLGYSPIGSLTGTHYSNALLNPDRHDVSPILSIAWRPIFGSSMVVRGGYGVYYNTGIYNAIAAAMSQQAPLSKSLNVTNSPSDPLTLANGFNASPGVIATTFGVDPNFRIGYTQNFYVSVQQNVTSSLLLTAQYTGVRGTRAAQVFEPNTYPEGALDPCPLCLPGYKYLASNGTSHRDAGILTLRRRFHMGVSAIGTYTYSKAIDDAGTLGSASTQVAQNWLDLAGERALSTFDQRNNVNLALQYSTGVGVHGGALLSGWRGQLLKGWTFQSAITAGSGLPFTPYYNLPMPGTGTAGVLRPEYVGGSVYQSGASGRFLNAAAYAAPPSGQWGDAGRDSLIGPSQFSFNGSAARSFMEKYTLTVAATNILNHPVLSGWNSTFNPMLPSGGSFGLPLGAGTMRQITATFRWTF